MERTNGPNIYYVYIRVGYRYKFIGIANEVSTGNSVHSRMVYLTFSDNTKKKMMICDVNVIVSEMELHTDDNLYIE